MQGEYKVYKVGDKYQIFYCPSAPIHYNDKHPYDEKMYPKRQAAYRRCKQLNQQAAHNYDQPDQSGKTELHSSIPDSAPKAEDLSPIN